MKRMMTLAVLAVLAGTCLAQRRISLEDYEIGKELVTSLDNWDQSADDYVVDHSKNGFKFTDDKKRNLGCAYPTISIYGTKVMETRLFFTKDRSKIDHIEFSLYNKGDAATLHKTMNLDDFKAMLETVTSKLSDGGETPKTTSRELAGNRTYTRKWAKRKPVAELSWGLSGEKRGAETVEYATLKLFRVDPDTVKKDTSAKAGPAVGSAASCAANVRHTEDGDAYIPNVPMVDQGQKGYCAVATSERVLRYFGNDVNEHQLAQMAGTEAQGGTTIESMVKAAEIIGKKCGLGKIDVVSKIRTFSDIENQITKYNQAAKKMKRPTLDIATFTKQRGSSIAIDVEGLQHAMEPKVLKEMSMKDSSGFKRFQSGVKAQIDRGIPLIWSVQLGIYPEPEIPQAAGGHMRLIIGYNAESKEILYSDTWGAGHELKRMPEEWAWTITANMFYLKPRK